MLLPLASGAIAQTTRPSGDGGQSSTQPADPWASFKLKETTVGPVRFRYAPSLEKALPQARRILRETLDLEKQRWKSLTALAADANAHVAELQKIASVELTPAQQKSAVHLFRFFVRRSPLMLAEGGRKTTIVFVPGERCVEYTQRTGRTLPGVVCDPNAGVYKFAVDWAFEGRSDANGATETAPAPQAITFGPERGSDPNRGLEVMEAFLGRLLQETGKSAKGTAFHETAEMVLLHGLAGMDPNTYRYDLRWFTDGMANAIAVEMLTRHAEKEAAATFLKGFDPNTVKDIRPYTNLLHWQRKELEALVALPYEQALTKARYTFATVEARYLLDKHGLGCVKKILEADAALRKRGRTDLLEAIRQATGEDMEKRLKAYQSFDTTQEGLLRYAGQYTRAMRRGDTRTATSAILRASELQLEATEVFGRAMCTLHLAGQTRRACKSMWARLGHFRKFRTEKEYLDLCLEACRLSILHGHPVDAAEEAELVLETRPNQPLALAVRAWSLIRQKKTAEAHKVAHRVLRLVRDRKSLAAQAARKALSDGRRDR